tara:strand:- start:892 stop:1128 length:237 start_codon:yes stop_codon:yes gene_type:complete
MAELTEQQKHLQSVLQQQQEIVTEINTLDAQARSKREMAVKLQGIVEYLNGIGVKLPEPEEAAPETTESDTSNTEIVQ